MARTDAYLDLISLLIHLNVRTYSHTPHTPHTSLKHHLTPCFF
ncbi:MAG: hypothetical protein AAGJ08_16035 [Cyanobacteria bacterium P01_H01_bin.35]